MQHQKELKDRIQCYRALQVGLLEKVRKDGEEKEVAATKNSSVAAFLDGDKGKGLMEDLPEVPVSQQVKVLILTSTQSKQKIAMMTFVLNTQAVTAAMTVTDIPVIAVVSQPSDTEEIVEKKTFKRLKVKVSSSTGPIIDLVDLDLEEEVIASAPVTEEVDQYLQSLTDFLDGDGKKDSIHVSIVSQSSSVSMCSYAALLLSSIHTLSTFPEGGRISPTLSELY